MIKRLAGFVVVLVVILLCIGIVRALLLKPQHASIKVLPVDEAAALARFAGAVRIQTISQPLAKPDPAAMLSFRNYLK